MVPIVAAMNAPALESASLGTVVVAKAEGNALIIWDAGAMLASMKQKPEQEVLRTIEANAARILVERAPRVPRAQTISVKVIYTHNPELNPAYGVSVISGIERLLTVTAKRTSVPKDGESWFSDLQQGKTPTDLTLNVTGKLPW